MKHVFQKKESGFSYLFCEDIFISIEDFPEFCQSRMVKHGKCRCLLERMVYDETENAESCIKVKFEKYMILAEEKEIL